MIAIDFSLLKGLSEYSVSDIRLKFKPSTGSNQCFKLMCYVLFRRLYRNFSCKIDFFAQFL